MKEPLLISACLLGEPCRYDGKSKPLPAEQLRFLREYYELHPVCPESDGGLPTPRIPSERRGGRVLNRVGEDVSVPYARGAARALEQCREHNCRKALLKERSPSCGCGEIYDGSFSGTLIPGDGVTAALLKAEGIEVLGESVFFEKEYE